MQQFSLFASTGFPLRNSARYCSPQGGRGRGRRTSSESGSSFVLLQTSKDAPGLPRSVMWREPTVILTTAGSLRNRFGEPVSLVAPRRNINVKDAERITSVLHCGCRSPSARLLVLFHSGLPPQLSVRERRLCRTSIGSV